jgi:hypothetical protein
MENKAGRLDSIGHKEQVVDDAEKLRTVISRIAWGMTGVFGFLQIGNAIHAGAGSFWHALVGTPATAIWHLALAIYFASWCAGTSSDLLALRAVLVRSPLDNRWRAATIAIGSLVATFLPLCLIKTPAYLAPLLVVFWTADLLSVAVAHRRYVKNAEHDTRDECGHDMARIVKLQAVVHQNIGSWRWWRYGVGHVLIGFLLLVAFYGYSLPVGDLPAAGPSGGFSLGFLVFVVIVEGWMWDVDGENQAPGGTRSDRCPQEASIAGRVTPRIEFKIAPGAYEGHRAIRIGRLDRGRA